MSYKLSKEELEWVERKRKSKRNKGIAKKEIINRLTRLKGCCEWSGVKMLFDKKSCSPPSKRISATIEHNSPGTLNDGFSIVCHYLNDSKGKLPLYLFEILKESKEWKNAMSRMRKRSKTTSRQESDTILIGFIEKPK